MVGLNTVETASPRASVLEPGASGLVLEMPVADPMASLTPGSAPAHQPDVSFASAGPSPSGPNPQLAQMAEWLGCKPADVAKFATQDQQAFGKFYEMLEQSARQANNLAPNGSLTAAARNALPVGAQISMSHINRDDAANAGGPGGPENTARPDPGAGSGGPGATAKKEAGPSIPAGPKPNDRIETTAASADGKEGIHIKVVKGGVVSERIEHRAEANSSAKPDPEANKHLMASAGPSPRAGAKNFGVLHAELAASTHAASPEGGKPSSTQQASVMTGNPIGAPQGRGYSLTPPV